MQYEVPLLQELGFEVFVPKVIPDDVGFRSAGVSHASDAGLTLPKGILDKLNACNFYTESWSDEIVTLLNRYFDTSFIFHYGRQSEEVLLKFSGQIVFRAFGYENCTNYADGLSLAYGHRIHALIKNAGKRFWFGVGYTQLVEAEGPFFSERAVHLPLGLPDSFHQFQDTWTGSSHKVMTVCPNLVSNPMYADYYRHFQSLFGHLPCVIAGAQDIPVEDPSVTGFVSDEELTRLYQTSAVFYYQSRVKRHVHYSPLEAVIVGTPVVFYEDCLFSRLYERKVIGAVSSPQEAQAVVDRILGGDQVYIENLRRDQKGVLQKFSHACCLAIWKENLSKIGIGEKRDGVFRRLMAMIKPPPAPCPPHLTGADAPSRNALVSPLQVHNENTLEEGIHFEEKELPLFLHSVEGLLDHEEWGRWSNGPLVTFRMEKPLEGALSIELTGGAYKNNIGQPITVRVGKSTRTFRFRCPPWEPETKVIRFRLPRPETVIEFAVPHPVVMGQGAHDRGIGIGFRHMRFIKEEEPAPTTGVPKEPS